MKHVIGKRIREERKKRGISLEDLAALTGFTKGYLSKVENSTKPPPIYTLVRISDALKVDLATLLLEQTGSDPSVEIDVTRKDGRFITDGRGTPYGYIYEGLALNKRGKNMNPFIVTVSGKGDALFSHEGEEFLYVLEGSLEFYFRDKVYRLEEGDCIYFDSAVPHGGKSLGDKPAKILIVVYSYKRL